MGTDIHMIGDYKPYSGWEEREFFVIPPKFQSRNYNFFAGLSGVRNGFGFAGVARHTPVVPLIPEDRGFPDWLDNEVNVMPHPKGDEEIIWLGDHSFGWCTLEEFKNYDWAQSVTATGVLSEEAYSEWDKINAPESWSGGFFGDKTETVSRDVWESMTEKDSDKDYYIQVTWEQPLVNPEFISEFITFLEAFVPDYEGKDSDVRIFVGYDS